MTNPYIWRQPDNRWAARLPREGTRNSRILRAAHGIKVALVARDLADPSDDIYIDLLGEMVPGFDDFQTQRPYITRDAGIADTVTPGSRVRIRPGVVPQNRIADGNVSVVLRFNGTDILVMGPNRFDNLRAAWVRRIDVTPTRDALTFRLPEVGDHVLIHDCTEAWH